MLFLRMNEGHEYTETLVEKIKSKIREERSRRHVPRYVFQTWDIETSNPTRHHSFPRASNVKSDEGASRRPGSRKKLASISCANARSIRRAHHHGMDSKAQHMIEVTPLQGGWRLDCTIAGMPLLFHSAGMAEAAAHRLAAALNDAGGVAEVIVRDHRRQVVGSFVTAAGGRESARLGRCWSRRY